MKLRWNHFELFPANADITTPKRVKFGIDPTAPQLHLGHFVPLRVVKKALEAGHNVTVVLGTYTAQLGDPSGQDKTRPILTRSAVEENADRIIEQTKKVLGPGQYNFLRNGIIHHNGQLPEFFSVISKFTVNQVLSRDGFQARMLANQPIGLHELLVPFLQGQDSVFLKTEIEIGGSDQLFNFQIARKQQEIQGQKPQACILCPIINGTDGKKMSKSTGNCIFLSDSPEDIFGKTMSIPDSVVEEWIGVLTDLTDLPGQPMQRKKVLAFDIVRQLCGEVEAATALEHFESICQRKEDGPPIPIKATTLLMAVAAIRNCSKTEAKRVIQQGGAEIDKMKILDENANVKAGQIIRAGKRQFGVVE